MKETKMTWVCPKNCDQRMPWGSVGCPDDLMGDEVCPRGEVIRAGRLFTARIGSETLPRCDYYMLAVRFVVPDRRASLTYELALKLNPEASITHEPSLAPNNETYQVFRSNKDIGNWDWDVFTVQFAPLFVRSAEVEPMKSSIYDLKNILADGSDVCILCYCYHDHLCHRSLVRDIINQYGYHTEETKSHIPD